MPYEDPHPVTVIEKEYKRTLIYSLLSLIVTVSRSMEIYRGYIGVVWGLGRPYRVLQGLYWGYIRIL